MKTPQFMGASILFYAAACAAVSPAVPSPGMNAPAAVASAVAPQPSLPLRGTLFYSDQQRAQMDRARARGEAGQPEDAGEAAPPVVNGIVNRSDGRIVIWVDGKPRQATARGAAELQAADIGGARARVQVRQQRTLPSAGDRPTGK